MLSLNSARLVRAYESFKDKHGYYPKIFQPWNTAEVKDICPTIGKSVGGVCSSATILILEEENA